MSRWAVGLAIGLVAALSCSAVSLAGDTPASAQAPSQPAPQVAAPAPDACGASALQSLIGRPRTEAPVAIDPSRQRVACTTCPAAEDHDPERLNILFDAETGVIKQVSCG